VEEIQGLDLGLQKSTAEETVNREDREKYE
jgi:hypothetical protein